MRAAGPRTATRSATSPPLIADRASVAVAENRTKRAGSRESVEASAGMRIPGAGNQREAEIARYGPLVRRVAAQLLTRLPPSVELDDLVQAGMIGLCDSLARFRTGLGAQFETFAMQRIRGAMLDELRDADWLPRSVRRSQRAIDGAVRRLEQHLQRAPVEREVAEALGAHPDIESITVYGVELPGEEGRAGMAAIALKPGRSFDPGSFYELASTSLPAYARPLFVRILGEADITSTFKLRKTDLQKMGALPGPDGSAVYALDAAHRTYVPRS